MPKNKAAIEIKILLEKYLKLDLEIVEDLFNKIDNAIDEAVLKAFDDAKQQVNFLRFESDKFKDESKNGLLEAFTESAAQKLELQKHFFKSAEKLNAEANYEKYLEEKKSKE